MWLISDAAGHRRVRAIFIQAPYFLSHADAGAAGHECQSQLYRESHLVSPLLPMVTRLYRCRILLAIFH